MEFPKIFIKTDIERDPETNVYGIKANKGTLSIRTSFNDKSGFFQDLLTQ